jgi:hypothetical protein
MSGDAEAHDLPRDAWTVIAERPRRTTGFRSLIWSPIPWAPLDLDTAHQLRLQGVIYMANRHSDDRVELVVRPARDR